MVGHAFDHKSWNKAKEFDAHIAPKLNKVMRQQDERFNRLTITCAIVLYHIDDVESFLERFEHVTNQLACIVRCFLDLEFLKVLYCAGALIGLHLVEPFLSLTTSSTMTYSKLIPAFQTLYEDLLRTDSARLMNTETPAFQFVSQERFDQCKYDDEICDAIKVSVEGMENEIQSVLDMILPKLAAGFKKQKGDIFGLEGEDSEYSLSKMDPEKLEKAPIHNLNAERSVGFINYELHRRGAKELPCASSSQVKAKSTDLIDKRPSGSYRAYRTLVSPGGRLPQIMQEWNEKQDDLVEQGLDIKQAANVAVDKRRNRDLQELKQQGGPFTSSEEVDEYINSGITEDLKNKRLYLEIRYARDMSLSIPKGSDIFRLKRNYKNLPTNTYATNLKVYLRNVTCKTSVSFTEFVSAVQSLQHV